MALRIRGLAASGGGDQASIWWISDRYTGISQMKIRNPHPLVQAVNLRTNIFHTTAPTTPYFRRLLSPLTPSKTPPPPFRTPLTSDIDGHG